jgi:hypothetical protein
MNEQNSAKVWFDPFDDSEQPQGNYEWRIFHNAFKL